MNINGRDLNQQTLVEVDLFLLVLVTQLLTNQGRVFLVSSGMKIGKIEMISDYWNIKQDKNNRSKNGLKSDRGFSSFG